MCAVGQGVRSEPAANPPGPVRHLVDGFNSWSASITITAAYADACKNGGTIEISPHYAGAEAIPSSCASVGVNHPVQPFPMVLDYRLTQTAIKGKIDVLSFGVDGSGATNTTMALQNAWSAAELISYGTSHAHTLYFPVGNYLINEANLADGRGIALLEGESMQGSWIHYGGAGGSGSYLYQDNGNNFGGARHIRMTGYNYGETVTTMAQDLIHLGSNNVDAGVEFEDLDIGGNYGNTLTFGGGPNFFMRHFRMDGVGGYGWYIYPKTNGGNGDPYHIYDYTFTNGLPPEVKKFGIARGYISGTGSTPDCYSLGEFFVHNADGLLFDLENARDEENIFHCDIGNADEGTFWSDNDTGSAMTGPSVTFHNFTVAGTSAAAHPLVSTVAGGSAVSLFGMNSLQGLSSLYKNRRTQQEYGDLYQSAVPLWSMGRHPYFIQGIVLEGQIFDVIPMANRAKSPALREIGDWFIRRGTDMAPGAGGPIDVVVSPVSGRASMQEAQSVSKTAMLATNSSFNQSSLQTIATGSGSGGNISGAVGDTVILSGFNNGITGAIAEATLTTANSLTGATYTVLEQGSGATSAPTAATLSTAYSGFAGTATSASGTVSGLTSNLTVVRAFPIGSINSAQGGTISAAAAGRTCFLSSFNNGWKNGQVEVTFAASGSWTGATFQVVNSGFPANKPSTTAMLSSGTAVCSGTATINSSLANTYANVTNIKPLEFHPSLHIGDDLTILGSDAAGLMSTKVQIICIDAVGSGTECPGLSAQGIVVAPAPACTQTSKCAGPVEIRFTQATLSNFGLEANRVSSLPQVGSACPYIGDKEWLEPAQAGSPMGVSCAGSGWVVMPSYPSEQRGGDEIASASSGSDGNTFTGASQPGNTDLVNAGSSRGLMQGFVEQVGLGSAATFSGIGDELTQAPGAGAEISIASATQPIMLTSTSAPASGKSAGWLGQQIYYAGRQPSITFGVGYSASTDYSSNARIWLGLLGNSCSVATMLASDAPACQFAAIRYSTVAGDSDYKCVTGDGRSTTVTSMHVDPSTSFTKMRIDVGNASVTCTVGSTSVTNATTVPSSSAVMEDIFLNTTQANRATTLRLNGVYGVSQNGAY
jgi:hypothetical protein